MMVTVWQWLWQFLAVSITTPKNSNQCTLSLSPSWWQAKSFKRESTSGVWVYRPGHTYSYWKFSAVFDRTGSISKKPFASIFFIVMFYLLSEKIEAKARRPHICKYIKVSFLETFKNWNTSPSNFFQCMIFWFCLPGKSLAFARLKFGRSFVCQYF